MWILIIFKVNIVIESFSYFDSPNVVVSSADREVFFLTSWRKKSRVLKEILHFSLLKSLPSLKSEFILNPFGKVQTFQNFLLISMRMMVLGRILSVVCHHLCVNELVHSQCDVCVCGLQTLNGVCLGIWPTQRCSSETWLWNTCPRTCRTLTCWRLVRNIS